MSRQAGSMFGGISKPRRISVKTGRQQVRLCTAGAAKGQAAGNRKAKDPFQPAAIASVKIKDLAVKNLAGRNLAGRSDRATTAQQFQRVRQVFGLRRPLESRCKPEWLSHLSDRST